MIDIVKGERIEIKFWVLVIKVRGDWEKVVGIIYIFW